MYLQIRTHAAGQWFHRFVVSLALRRGQVIHVKTGVERAAFGQVYVRVLHFPISVVFNHCIIPIFVFVYYGRNTAHISRIALSLTHNHILEDSKLKCV